MSTTRRSFLRTAIVGLLAGPSVVKAVLTKPVPPKILLTGNPWIDVSLLAIHSQPHLFTATGMGVKIERIADGRGGMIEFHDMPRVSLGEWIKGGA